MLEQYTAYIEDGDMQRLENDLCSILLFDRSTRKNIIWATDDYESYGDEYHATSEIKPELITGEKVALIRPRTAKATEDQLNRVRDKAEVFTPSWVCNEQNNLIDEAWFDRKNVFNTVDGTAWKSTRRCLPTARFQPCSCMRTSSPRRPRRASSDSCISNWMKG